MIGYFKSVFLGIKSILGSCYTALPYLFGYGELRKVVTEQYPDPVWSRTEDDLPPKTRGLIYNDIERCTGCRDCEVVCPTRCIKIDTELGPNAVKKWVSVFDVDFSRCIFCGLCIETCQPNSLVHSKQYEGSVYKLEYLVTSFGRGKVTPEQQSKWKKMQESEEKYSSSDVTYSKYVH